MNKTYLASIKHYIDESSHKLNTLQKTSDAEAIFDYWTKSDLAQDFFKSFNKNKQNISKASKEMIKIEEARIKEWNTVFLKNKKISRKFYIEDAGDLKSKKTATIIFGKHSLQFITPFVKDLDKHLEKTTNAITKLQQYFPQGLLAFFHYTNTVVVINKKEFVSYSSQDLPGISNINYYDRDFVDHMDDLLHENGHHILNTHLRKKKLIAENTEQIFYSPWRRTLRPIRGIYHAYLTFLWALLLFKNLIQNGALEDKSFKSSEKQKMIYRFLEELLMLQYSRYDLDMAFQKKLITKAGIELILSSDDELKNSLKLQDKMSQLLSVANKKKILKLQTLLSEQRKLNHFNC